MTHHLLLLLPLLASVWGDADPWVDNDLYYGTVYQGEVAYSAGPTYLRSKSSRPELHAQAVVSSYAEAPAAYVQPAVNVQPAAYVQPAVQPAYLSHQYIRPQPTVFAAEYSQLPVSDFYATDYQGYNSYLAPAPVATHTVTHSNYAAPPAPVAAPVAVAAAAPVAVAAAPHAVAAAAPRAVAAAPVAVASHGDYQSVSSSQYHSQDEEGNYAFGYNNVNGARQEEGNSLTGVMGSYTGAAGNTVHYVADQWGFRLV